MTAENVTHISLFSAAGGCGGAIAYWIMTLKSARHKSVSSWAVVAKLIIQLPVSHL